MKLYELSNSYSTLIDLMSNEEVDSKMLEDTLESISEEIGIKFENISKLIKNLEGDIEVFKKEEERLNGKRKSMENKVKWLKNYMLDSLVKTGFDSVKAGTFKVAKQKNNPSLSILNEEKIPMEYKNIVPQSSTVDKKKVLDLLKSGEKVEGAEIAPTTYHVRIR